METDGQSFLFSDLEKFLMLIMEGLTEGRDGKRFNNFLINLSSFEILIVLSAPDGTYGCNCYLSCPVSSKLGQTLYVFGAELGFKNLLISGQ